MAPRRTIRTPEEAAIVRQNRSNGQRLRQEQIRARQQIPVNRTNAEINTENLTNRQRAQRRRRQSEVQTRQQFDTFDNNRDLNSCNNEDFLGLMDLACVHCGALHFADEKIPRKGLSFNDCCSHGAAILLPFPAFPVELEKLFKGEHEKSNDFFSHIRHYNNSFAFASFNANLMNFPQQRPGPYCFKVQGQIYYQINTSLYPSNGEMPSYGQLFIIDQQEAIHHRIARDPVVDYEIISTIDTIMRNNNNYAKSYEMMHNEIEAQRNANEIEPEMQLLFSLKPGQDIRRYNAQRTNEVAAIFTTTADGEIPNSYVTIRNKNTKNLEIVNSMSPDVEAWIYPLFYPYGTPGWHHNMPSTAASTSTSRHGKITRNAYTKNRMAIRPNEFNPIILGRRLFQQWLVDSYIKVERDKIGFIINNQKQLRADTYKGLNDYMRNAANDINGHVGKTVILPSTFVGSPRYMQQNYQDAMAIVSKTGKPDIFLTMTSNPHWREIQENLLPGQQTSDRPDLVARVFHLKKKRLLSLITKENFFGKPVAYVYVVEF